MDSNQYYTKWSLFGGAFAGGPIVAGYLLSKNFSLLGDDSRSSYALWGGVSVALVAIPVLILLPTEWGMTTIASAASGLWAGLAITVYQQFQEDQLRGEFAEDFDPAPVWKVAGITIVGMVVYLLLTGVIIFAVTLSPLSLPGESSGATDAGTEQITASLTGSSIQTSDTDRTVYFASPVTKEQASTAGLYLEAIGYFSKESETVTAVKLESRGEEFRLLLPVHPTVQRTYQLRHIAESIVVDLSRWLDAPVHVTTVSMDADGKRLEHTYQESDFAAGST